MLRFIRHGQRWIVGAIIILIGGVFVFFIGLGQPLSAGAGGSVVVVDGIHYDVADLLRERERQEQIYREALGDAYEQLGAEDQLDSIAANVLIQRAILSREAQRLGLRTSEEELRAEIRRLGRQSGLYSDEESYRSFIEWKYGTEAAFLRALREDLLIQKVLHILRSSAEVSEQEARDALVRAREEIRLAIVALDTTEPPPGLEIPDADVEEALEARADRIRALHEERADAYHQPERVRARHVLVKLEEDASEAEEEVARERAAAIRARLRDGADFAELARAESDDAGTREQGGDLGFFERGQMVAPFEEAAFALEPGVLSEPVRSPFGFHVIRVEEHRPEEVEALEDVQEDLAREILRAEAAEAHATETMARLEAAVREGRSLEEAARAEEVSIERTAMLRRREDGFVAGVGISPELQDTAFALTMEAPSSDRVFEIGTRRVMVQLLERKLPSEAEIEAALAEERERLRNAKLGALQSSWIEARRSTLEREGRVQVNLALLER